MSPMRRIHREFQTVSVTRQYSGKCPACGRPVRRSRTFEQTVNPWNTSAPGIPKTVEEVYADVRREAADHTPDFTHAACRKVAEG